MSKRTGVIATVSLLSVSVLVNMVLYMDRYYTSKVLRETLIAVDEAYREAGARLPDDVERPMREAARDRFSDREKVLRLRDASRRREAGGTR